MAVEKVPSRQLKDIKVKKTEKPNQELLDSVKRIRDLQEKIRKSQDVTIDTMRLEFKI